MDTPNSNESNLGLTDVSPTAVFSGAAAMTAISATPYLNIVNVFLGLGIALGGAIALLLIKQIDRIDLNPSLGFKFGAWSGLFGAVATIVVINCIVSFMHYDVTAAQTKFVTNLFTQKTSSHSPDGVGIGPYYVADANGNVIPADSLPVENLDRNIWVDFGIAIPLFALFGGIGGAIAVAFKPQRRK